MNPFAAIEDACAAFVERTFARVFPSDVAPAQIARKLVATSQSEPAETYLVRLNPRDFGHLGADRELLESDWGALLAQSARSEGRKPAGVIRVLLAEDESVVAGTVSIDALLDDDAAAAARGYALRIVKGIPPNARFPVEGPVTIGRGPENRIDLLDVRVSRKHAQVRPTAEGVILEDFGSTNGTTVNGQLVQGPIRIVAGDAIGLGDTILRLEVADD